MDDEPFEDSLERYGPDLARWPGALAPAGRTLVERSPRARELLAEARELESTLDDLLPCVGAPLGLRTRVLVNLPAREAWLDWLTVKAWRPVALALLPLAVGFGVGLNAARTLAMQEAASEDDVLLALFDPDELARFELPSADTGGQR